jgi:uncharacterized Zn finger protein
MLLPTNYPKEPYRVILPESNQPLDLDVGVLLRAIDHFLVLSEPKYREMELLDRLMQARKALETAVEQENKAILVKQDEEVTDGEHRGASEG